MLKLHNNSRLRQVELNMIDVKIDDALNFAWNKIIREKINRDKHKGIDEYVISNKLNLLERVYDSINYIISGIENKINIIYKDMYEVYEKGIDKLRLINDKVNEIVRQSNKDLRNIISLEDLQQK